MANHEPVAFDVVVAGAGPAGSATARWLSMRGYRVALVERSRFEAPRIGETLAPGVQPLLRELSVWENFLALAPMPSWGIRSLWGGAETQSHSHLFNPYGCGWHVDRRAFDHMLAHAAVAVGAQLFEGMNVEGSDQRQGGWQVRLAARPGPRCVTAIPGPVLSARVLIDATGRRAQVARRLGAQRLMFDRLVGVSTQWEGIEATEQGHLMIESSRDGWWYSAPLPGGTGRQTDPMIAMLMTDADLCGRGRMTDAAAWQACLEATSATRHRLASARCVSAPKVHSASSHRLRRKGNAGGGAWLAVGDAALAVDPVSGSGVVRALRTARAAADAVIALIEGKTRQPIEAYEADRDLECTRYLYERAFYYGIEKRWRESSFWQRRADFTSYGNSDLYYSRRKGVIVSSNEARAPGYPRR